MRALRNLILENWSLKLTSLFLAWILWLFVRGDPGAERVITVPLEVRIPPHMEITNERPNTVDVTVRGTLSNSWFGQQIPTCTLNLQAFDEGEHVVPLSPGNVQIPRSAGLEVLKVNPARITLVLERTISREVPIIVPLRGNPAPGFEVYGKSASPGRILITGPRSHVDAITQIPTEQVSVTGQKQSIRMFANLNIRDNTIRSTPVGPVEVQVTVVARTRLRTISRVPVRTDDRLYSTSPSRVSVELLLTENFKGSVTPDDISVSVSTTDLDKSKLPMRTKPEVRLGGKLDPLTLVKGVLPAEVTVRRR